MSKYKYSETEKEINKVLKYQEKQLNSILFDDKEKTEELIKKTEQLLKNNEIIIPDCPCNVVDNQKRVVIVKNWDSILKEANQSIQEGVVLEDLFTDFELSKNKICIQELNSEFNQIHELDAFDVGISALAGMMSGVVDVLLIGIPKRTPEGLKAGHLSNFVRLYFDKVFPEKEMQELANSKVSKVPFDAQDNRNTTIYVEGLSAYYHRLLQLGHDPLLGFIFGVVDILNGTMTTISKTGEFKIQYMENYEDRREVAIFAALCRQVLHLKSDITTSMGLPVPLMSLFNFLQIGEIGEYDQTIAEIVQGMYYEGYDFIHFCSMSLPMMINEVVVRLGYALKRIKEGNSIKESIPFSTNREKHPKLATMLFIAHSAATAINAGKVAFTENPMAINYPQWVAFAKYSYLQFRWSILEKIEYRDKYVLGEIDEQLYEELDNINLSFDEMFKDCIIVFE